MNKTLRIATRKSALALWQAEHVQALLREAHAGIEIELVKIVTEGDRILDRPLAEIGGKGLFLKELERAMLNGEADLAVHSMKDVPAKMADGLVLDAVLPRANPYDALVSRDNRLLADIPAGSVIGTSSLRRRSQLLALRPDLVVRDLRGNVDTRLRKLDEGLYDAIILACAGLQRLGLGERITETLQMPDWLPASTQGIIGLQCRQEDEHTRALIAPLADTDTMVVASAERAVAQVLEATCQVPLAVHAVLDNGTVSLQSMVSSIDGRNAVRAAGEAPAANAVALGQQAAADLLENGAGEIIADL
ncbi:MAG: hydroxymethylbilane synthase [Xanthomonadales bacterium]|nr:hydroxymethylbilane synthase [Gammaproteobacteria bacterium]MBT8072114.1 hydroxymethylbilane synthase [Gammaproteobacteria bacterium]MBT8075129.1 hydroxymethylbilane synthase [Gammaproteobacteria bacterium]NNK02954.1 hydroxymethylbilane synthase [Xanthomonadales bacterium]NNK98333.1 hydroxymethylbilane synthase [Xanthomonadales bacterium]